MADVITAVVLCGGRGSRMGDRDKPLLEYRGQPIVARIVDTLHECVARVLISANRNLASYRRYAVVIEDTLVDHGPLAGIAACLQRCETSYAFVCPGDAPNLNASMIARLHDALTATDAVVAVAHDGQQRQNLHLLVRVSARHEIQTYLATGARSAMGWLERVATIDVDCADIAESFVDLDYPEDFDPRPDAKVG